MSNTSQDPLPRLAELRALAARYAETSRLPLAAQALQQLIDLEPREETHYHALASVLERQGRMTELTALYQQLLAVRPECALAHFNLACAHRAQGKYEAALAAHHLAIAHGIDRPQEVWTNIGVILGELRRHAQAREAFTLALALDSRWIPALYNLALWHEEHGEREAAQALFARILELQPDYHEARVRMAHLRRVEAADDPLFAEIQAALLQPQQTALQRESLLFALGKIRDDCGHYDAAFAAYRAGNEASRSRMQPYDRRASEAFFADIRAHFATAAPTGVQPLSQRPLLFVCGMFRSGTTLLERMLAAHPAIQAGGEIGYWSARLRRHDSGYPHQILADTGRLTALGTGYLELLERRFPGAMLVCDKRPDNFLYLGLLHALFPHARFIHMRRDPLDTCLSIYFQQFDGTLGYACDLGDTAHYLQQYRRLMAHWRGLLRDSILELDYEGLVEDPARELRRACRFLALDWDESMLQFHAATDRVRTASLWQVREPLHARSVGRCRHYAAYLGALTAKLAEEPRADEH